MLYFHVLLKYLSEFVLENITHEYSTNQLVQYLIYIDNGFPTNKATLVRMILQNINSIFNRKLISLF